MDKTPMTAEGAEALRLELKRLTSVERPRIVTRDLSGACAGRSCVKMPSFSMPKKSKAILKGRISEIAAKLGAAQVINIKEIAPNTGQGHLRCDRPVRLLNVESMMKRSPIQDCWR